MRVPEPGYATALNKYAARLAAENMTAVPPSFAQYVQSGGTARFPVTDPGLTPKEMTQLGLVTRSGQPIPFGTANQKELTPEQKLFLGGQRYWDATHGQRNWDVRDDILAKQYAKEHGLPLFRKVSSGGLFDSLLNDLTAGGYNVAKGKSPDLPGTFNKHRTSKTGY